MNLIKKYPYIDFVMSLTPGGMKSGKEAIIELLAYIGCPQDTLQVFHVTGSNGKGSVCQMLSQVLYKEFGKKVGLFTSPHLVDITERFQINGAPISYSELNKYYKKVLSLTKKYDINLSFFEIQVVVMVLYFCDQKVDYAVVEVGLGGLHDGTNIFTHPLACFITGITLEHTHILGKTKRSILRNKLGIVKSYSKLYTHLHNQQVKRYCARIGAHLQMCQSSQKNQNLTNLPGKHQQKNALLVLQSLLDIGLSKEKILRGLKNIHNPGRFEYICPNILVDTANNEQNIKILKQMIPEKFHEAKIIFGTTQMDPEYVSRLLKIFPRHTKILVDGFCDRALPCSTYAQLNSHNDLWHLNTDVGTKKMQKIFTKSHSHQKYIIFGSLYLISYIMKLSRYRIFAKQ